MQLLLEYWLVYVAFFMCNFMDFFFAVDSSKIALRYLKAYFPPQFTYITNNESVAMIQI